MKLLKPSPHRARNDFDLSHRHVYTANFGELLPSTCIETVPGDHIVLHASDLLRAIPMVTSPFLRAKQHIDVWFVPYKDLWHNFDNFITQKEQPVSSALRQSTYCPHFNLYDLWNHAQVPNASGIAYDIVGRPFDAGAKKLLNLLGYGYTTVGSSTAQNVEVNPFRLYAYNYIWYNEYRQKYYDDGTYGFISGTDDAFAAAELFNADFMHCGSVSSANIASPTYGLDSSGHIGFAALLQMRYRTWKKDLFTGLLPSTQFGSVSTVPVPNIDSALKLVDTSGNDVTQQRALTLYQSKLASSSQVTNGQAPATWANSNLNAKAGTFNLDVLALRRSEAVQIWRENALRAGNRVADNMNAHYGVESDFRDHRPTYLGSVSSPLNIGDVMVTANSDYSGNTNPNTNVGDVAGKGLSSLNEKVFTYDAKDFGVIMAIHSILPEAEYNAQGVSRPNQLLESEDFFVPEYENLGLEAVSSQNFVNVVLNDAKVVGYAPRYYAYKTKLDKCYGEFMTSKMFAPWCSPKYDVTLNMGSPGYSIPLACLYVNPAIFDVNFNVAVSVSDQFLCDVYYDVDAVRPMSVVGLPFS